MTNFPQPGRQRPAGYRATSTVGEREIVFVTVTTANRNPILTCSPEVHALLVGAWAGADAWLVGRYVIMPDHVHFFCAPGEGTHSLEEWMRYWKAAVTRSWPNADEKPIWQRAYWDTRLRRGENYTAKWNYVRENPVRAGLVTEPDAWPYQGEMHRLDW